MLSDPTLWGLFAFTGIMLGVCIARLALLVRARRFARKHPYRSLDEGISDFGSCTNLTTVVEEEQR